jgi:thymidine phosphorylase
MTKRSTLKLQKLGIDTYKEAIVYMRQDCHICLAEGFEAPARVRVILGNKSIIATVNIVTSNILKKHQASLSDYAWQILDAKAGDKINVVHAKQLESQSFVRSKIYGNSLSQEEFSAIISDIAHGQYSDIYTSAFLSSCAGGRMSLDEMIYLTKAMVDVGDKLKWQKPMIVDKHCVGGLAGNRTTPIIVAIVASFGLTMPKTSSRAITSPSGTADAMEVLAPVIFDIKAMQKIIRKQNGCIVWGGGVSLSPADDILIHVERALNLDAEGQLVASILSKKISAGSTHIVIDIPIGPTAKIRDHKTAEELSSYLKRVGQRFDITIKTIFTDGTKPVGHGIGPSLEARDVVAVLQNDKGASQDLRERALLLASHVLEFAPNVKTGEGLAIATEILDNGKAWHKFQEICEAQGGMRQIPLAKYTKNYIAKNSGMVTAINNGQMALIAKLAGAPNDKAAGVDLHVTIGNNVTKNDALFTIHADSLGQLDYALNYLKNNNEIITIS